MNSRQHANLSAYDEVERLEGFASDEAVRAYRAARLQAAAPAARCVLDMAGDLGRPLDVLDIGCGSGALLLALDGAGALGRGLGVDISASRIAFGRHWLEQEGRGRVRLAQSDVRRADLGDGEFDVCVLADQTFGYFHPVSPDMPAQVLDKARRALRPGGGLLLEVNTFAAWLDELRRRGRVTFWRRLPEGDAFEYALYGFTLGKDEVVEVESLYVDSRPETARTKAKLEFSRLYSREELARTVERAGFEVRAVHGGLDRREYRPGESDRLVMWAVRA